MERAGGGDASRAWLTRWRGSAIVQAIGSNIAIQVAQAFAQLALVPVFVTHWGVTVYGAWLLLFTLPAYVVMADLGFGSAAGNDMTASVARGEHGAATAVYQALRLVGLVSGTVVVTAFALLAYVVAPHLLDGVGRALAADARTIALALALYGVVGLQTTVVGAGYRATRGYALGGYIVGASLVIEAAGALALVSLGVGPRGVALWYLAVRTIAMAVLSLVLARRAPWLVTLRWQSSMRVLHRLIRPAAAVMVLPGALAASIQGTVLVIGAVLGSAAVPTFTAVRTLSRVAVQAILIVNHALMPSMTAARAVDDTARVARYAATSFLVSLALAVPGAVLLLVAGQWFVGAWTHGMLHPDLRLLAIMAAIMVLNAVWAPAANLILSINRHEGYSWYYLLMSFAGLAMAVPLTRSLGVAGAALSLLLVELAMVVRVAGLSRRLALFDHRAIAPLLRGWRRAGR